MISELAVEIFVYDIVRSRHWWYIDSMQRVWFWDGIRYYSLSVVQLSHSIWCNSSPNACYSCSSGGPVTFKCLGGQVRNASATACFRFCSRSSLWSLQSYFFIKIVWFFDDNIYYFCIYRFFIIKRKYYESFSAAHIRVIPLRVDCASKSRAQNI